MSEREEELKARVRETPLPERLTECRRRIGKMCSEGRPPRMTIPVQHDDDDFFICTTLEDAREDVARLRGALEDACLTYAVHGEQPPEKWLAALTHGKGGGNHALTRGDTMRGTGRTAKQMQDAPPRAVYIWVNEQTDYPLRLAVMLGRTDLTIVGLEWLRLDSWRGMRFTGVVLDHAAKLNSEEWGKYWEAVSRVRAH